MELAQLAKKLYHLVGRLNLRISFSTGKNKPAVARLESDIKHIKQLVSAIETKISRM